MEAVRFQRLKKVLCLGAHSDDIEIGCGATLLQLTDTYPDLEIKWVVFSSGSVRAAEARASARDFLPRGLKSTVVVKGFTVSFFPFEGEAIKRFFETLKSFKPDLVFTHYRDDRHQDHRVLSDLAWNTFRSHVILEYEIPKYDGESGTPNTFVPVSRAQCERKAQLLLKHFRSQSNKHWFTEELFMATPRIRGMECDSPTGYAEAFYSRKMILG
jgi:LmbE family N-acetylglucosaminyl deacetylase